MADRPRLHKLTRHAETLGSLELYARLAAAPGQPLTSSKRVKAATRIFREGVSISLASAGRLHGKHVEAMFAALVAALGQVDFLKVEDDGDCYARDDMVIPDYRIVTTRGQHLLVEVKNVAPGRNIHKFSLRAQDIDGLQRYARLTGAELRIALFWAKMGFWTLLSVTRFRRVGARYEIEMTDAFAGNEMVDLGDVMVSTVPPLVIELEIDPAVLSQDEVTLVKSRIRAVRIFAASKRVTRKVERELALFLMFYGEWQEQERHDMEDGKLRLLRFVMAPEEAPRPGDQPFASVGFLSQMFCRNYVMRTTQDGSVTEFHLETEPESLGALIPDDYAGAALRLWRFRISPKPEEV